MKGQSLWLYAHRRLKSDYFPHILWVRIWSFHLCPNKQLDFFLVRTHTALGIYATYCKRNTEGKGCCLILPQSGAAHLGTKCDSYYHDLRGNFIAVWLWRCQLGQWCMKLPPFIGMAFNQFLLGICPWLCCGGHPSPLLPASYYPIPFYTPPPSLHHHFTPCVNTISPVKKGTTTCFLVLLFLIDYAKYSSVPPHAFAIRRSWLGARWSSPTLPHPTLWPHPPLPHVEREVTERNNHLTFANLQQRWTCKRGVKNGYASTHFLFYWWEISVSVYCRLPGSGG